MSNTVKTYPGAYPHVEWIDLKGDGVLHECAVMKKDQFGNVYFFEIAKLDNVDKRRLFRYITHRTASQFELWDLLSQHTLANGVNALNYFHQLVNVITPSGRVKRPRLGEIGLGQVSRAGVVNTRAS